MASFNHSADHPASTTDIDASQVQAPARPTAPFAEVPALPIDQPSRGHCLVVVPTYNEALNAAAG